MVVFGDLVLILVVFYIFCGGGCIVLFLGEFFIVE